MLSLPPPCCAAARPLGDPVFAAVRAAVRGPWLSPRTLVGPWPPCRWDCEAARAAIAPSSPAWLLYADRDAWVVFEREGDAVSSVLESGPSWPSDALRPGDTPLLEGRTLHRGARGGLDLGDLGLLPLLLGPGGEGRPAPAPRVLALDVRRSRGDFTENTALRFAVGDLRHLGVPARLRVVETGLLDGGVDPADVAGSVDADVVVVEGGGLPGLAESLRARGVRTVYLATPQRADRAGTWDASVPSWQRTPILDHLLGGAPAPGPLPVVEPGGPGNAPGGAFAHPERCWPATTFEDADGAEHPYPRLALVANTGCPWDADAGDNPSFAGVDLHPGQRRQGCTFCAQGGDYGALPVADYPGWLARQIRWQREHAPGSQAVLGDEAGADVAAAVLARFGPGELRGFELLVKGRVERLARSLRRIEAGIAEAERSGARLVLYLVGLENASDAELERFNKGVSGAAIEAVVASLDALEQRSPGAFGFRSSGTHGYLLFTPWTTPADLRTNVDAARRMDLSALAPKSAVSRLRLFAWQPLASLARRDGLLLEAWPPGLRRHLGYKADELPWRFRDARTEAAYAAISRAWDRGTTGGRAWRALEGVLGAIEGGLLDPASLDAAADRAAGHPERGGPPREAPLSPFVDPLREAVAAAARPLLGAPDAVGIAVSGVGGDGPLGWLALTVSAPGQPAFRLRFADPGGEPAWAAGERFSVDASLPGGSAREHPGLRPLLRPLRRRLAGHADQGSDAWQALRDAWQALRPFAGVEDSHFRWIGPSGQGRRGMLRLGFRCNQDCSFCWQDRAWPEPPPERFFDWLEELATRELDHLFVSGGEPTTWRRLPELIERAARGHGMTVILQTNAIALASSRVLGRLMEAGLSSASISLHAGDAALSDAMTRAPGTFERTVAGIAACRHAGLPVHLTCVVERANLPGLAAHARAIVDRFVAPFPDAPRLSVAYAHPCLSADPEAFAAACPPLDDVRAPLAAATRILVDAGVSVTSVGGCGFPACALHDAPDLLVRLRPEDLRGEDSSSRRYGAACEGCAMKPWCIGLRREYVDVHGDAGLRPFAVLPPLPEPGDDLSRRLAVR